MIPPDLSNPTIKNVRNKHKGDVFLWILAMFSLAAISFGLLLKDVSQQYGAVAFGDFPSFAGTNSQGDSFDEHKLHGQLSAILIEDSFLNPSTIFYLQKLSQGTAMGKKSLKCLVFSNRKKTPPQSHFITLPTEQFRLLQTWQETVFKKGVFLVDQNGIIRGVFNLEDKLSRLNFESAVRALL